MSLLVKAAAFAAGAHAGQLYGDKRYVAHLEQTQNILMRFGFTQPEMLAVAWLHDTLEDCDVSVDDLAFFFGANLAVLIFAVTDEPGRSRKERKAATYPKIRKYGADAVCLKLADRIAKVEASIQGNVSLLQMYQKEWEEFYAALYAHEDGLEEMWKYLEQLLWSSHDQASDSGKN